MVVEMDSIEKTIVYYKAQSEKIISDVNQSSSLSADEIIEYGEKLAVLEYKLTALEIALTN